MKKKTSSRPCFLFVSSDKFPPFRPDVYTLFAEKMTSRGYQIDWLLQSEKFCKKSYEKEWHSGRVWVAATDLGTTRIKRLRKHCMDILNDLKMFYLPHKKQYDFILVKDKFISATLAIIATFFYNKKFIFWLSYPFPEASIYSAKHEAARYPLLYILRGHFWSFLLYRLILPMANHIFVQSEQMKKDIVMRGIKEKKITPISMGVKIEDIPFWGYPLKIHPNDEKILLYLGTLIRVRKLDFLVRVLDEVIQSGFNARLLFVGNGEDSLDEEIIRDEAERLSLANRIEITGFLPREEAFEYVKKADVCLSPIYPTPILNCASPTKLIEYMALGKAVVANDNPEQKLILEASKAGFCVPWNEQKFAEAIIQCLKNPDKMTAMGKSGREYVEKHRCYDIIADLLERELFKIVTG